MGVEGRRKKVSGGIDRQARCQGFVQSHSECLAVLFLHFFLLTSRRFGPHQPVTELTNSDQ